MGSDKSQLRFQLYEQDSRDHDMISELRDFCCCYLKPIKLVKTKAYQTWHMHMTSKISSKILPKVIKIRPCNLKLHVLCAKVC